MINIVVELSKYVILTLMIVYTVLCYYLVVGKHASDRKGLLRSQITLTFFLDFTAFVVIFLKTFDFKVVIFYAEMMIYFAAILILYRRIYKNASMLLLNNMCMLLSVGFIMLCRLDIASANKQLLIVACGSAVALVIPVMIRRMKFLKDLTWVYAGLGVVLLGAVLVLAQTSYGAKLSLMGIQPSEVIKITFVFFMASLLCTKVDFRKVVLATIVAVIHVGILVLSRDLGSAVIFFVTYLVLIYVATRNPSYLFLGLGGGCVGSVIAYHLFGHVRQRVSAWKDPMAVYQNEGYQIVQSLFAIGTGGWFGMGLFQGAADQIPVAESDFIFSAIAEEMGLIFALGLILVCVSVYMMFLNIAMQLRDSFYKLVALGLGTCYIFQTFLTIGGVTKFIPSTGVTLPLVSYGGTSVLSTIIMFAIIQGLYILREDEDEQIETQRKETIERRGKRATPERKRNRQTP